MSTPVVQGAQRWEYRRSLQVIEAGWDDPVREFMEWLNAAGQDGWELVNCMITPQNMKAIGKGQSLQGMMMHQQYENYVLLAIFKRPC
jgi:hypothetical protein